VPVAAGAFSGCHETQKPRSLSFLGQQYTVYMVLFPPLPRHAVFSRAVPVSQRRVRLNLFFHPFPKPKRVKAAITCFAFPLLPSPALLSGQPGQGGEIGQVSAPAGAFAPPSNRRLLFCILIVGRVFSSFFLLLTPVNSPSDISLPSVDRTVAFSSYSRRLAFDSVASRFPPPPFSPPTIP